MHGHKWLLYSESEARITRRKQLELFLMSIRINGCFTSVKHSIIFLLWMVWKVIYFAEYHFPSKIFINIRQFLCDFYLLNKINLSSCTKISIIKIKAIKLFRNFLYRSDLSSTVVTLKMIAILHVTCYTLVTFK